MTVETHLGKPNYILTKLWDSRGTNLEQIKAIVLEQRSPNQYSQIVYTKCAANGIVEIFENRGSGPVIYLTDDPNVLGLFGNGVR